NVTAGVATKLVMQTQPGNGTGGAALSPQPVVLIQDAQGNTVTGGSSVKVTAAIETNAGIGSLGGTKTVTAANGVATFLDLSIDKVGIGYTLVFTSSPALAGVTSNALNVTVGAAAKLGIQTQPASGTAGSALSPQPVVLIQDLGGNLVTDDSSTMVTAAFGTN